MQIRAAVCNEKFGKWTMEDLILDDPRDDEVLVKVIGSGICQTDVHARDGYFPNLPYPGVYGHEGAGIVEAVGAKVTRLKVGDHVVMCFPWCGVCPNCRHEKQTYCLDAGKLKLTGVRQDGSTLMKRKDGSVVYSAFFQQSSFGNYAIANERWAIKVDKSAPIEILGALACGVNTGAGAVLNAMKPRAGEAFVVFGVGGVGLAGMMGAKIRGCDPIIAVDVHENRLALAKSIGATHTINHTGKASVVDEIRQIAGKAGVRYTLETSALPQVLREAIDCLMPAGECILVGSARNGTEASFEMPYLQNGRTVRGVMQGESLPETFIPEMITHMQAGRMPIEKLVTHYAIDDVNQAAADAIAGKTIKPLLKHRH
jgi:aryl-alcohol dehydrogenase